MTGSVPLEFTGERFTPECVREIWYEHWHRYALVQPWAQGRRVLDAACGEGYGSALLARGAQSVLGLDISPAAVAHAVQMLMDDPARRIALGTSARRVAQQRFSPEIVVPCYESLYRRVIECRVACS